MTDLDARRGFRALTSGGLSQLADDELLALREAVFAEQRARVPAELTNQHNALKPPFELASWEAKVSHTIVEIGGRRGVLQTRVALVAACGRTVVASLGEAHQSSTGASQWPRRACGHCARAKKPLPSSPEIV